MEADKSIGLDRTLGPERGDGGSGSDGRALSDGEVFGPFRIVRLLGRGAMGEVYEAVRLKEKNTVALKVVAAELMGDGQAVARFRQEARTLCALNNPNIVAAFETGEELGRHWLSLQLCEGLEIAGEDGRTRSVRSLSEYVEARGGRLPQAELLTVLEDVLAGLAFAHGEGIVHRDLKPANILLKRGERGRPFRALVSDFGLVRIVGEQKFREMAERSVGLSLTRAAVGDDAKAWLGNWAYMSPEQKRGQPATGASDLYAVGLLAYRLGTGKDLGLESASELNPDLVPEWDAFIGKALEERPKARYASATQMLDDLAVIRAAWEQREAERRVAEKPRPSRRRIGLVATAVLALLALGTVHAVKFVLRHRAEEERERTEAVRSERAAQVEATLAKARQAMAAGQWQACVFHAAEVLALEAGNRDAAALKANAERSREVEAALAKARQAKETGQWQACATRAEEALALETGNAEAASLKNEAGHVIALKASLAAARQAKAAGQWQACATRAEEALALEAGSAEATSMKAEAEHVIALKASLAAARQAEAAGEWQMCVDRANEALALEAGNAEATALKAEAERVIALKAALAAARQAKAAGQWQVCSDRAGEALVLEAGNVEAAALRAEAEKILTPMLTVDVEAKGQRVAAELSDGERTYTAPHVFTLRRGMSYRFMVSFKPMESTEEPTPSKRYKTATLEGTVDWCGPKTQCVTLEEYRGPLAGKSWASPATGMEFVWVPMLKLWVGKYEVTNGEYRKKNRWHDSKDYMGYTLNDDRQPVVYVSYFDAKAYAAWLTDQDGDRLDGLRYRVISEAEWQTCAQCGDGREYPWGGAMPPKWGNYSDTTSAWEYKMVGYTDGYAVTCPVERSGANEWGINGLGGNVWECCASDVSGSAFGAWRGASWYSLDPEYLRCAYRDTSGGVYRGNIYGFRLALSR